MTAPTCLAEGYTTHTCQCGDTYVDTYVAASGHNWSDWTVRNAASCAAVGFTERTCHCGAYEQEELERLPHTFENEACATCRAFQDGCFTLPEDAEVSLDLDEDIHINLNGFDLSGTIITNGFKVYGMDFSTDSYCCDNVGYFTCVDELGNPIVPERICDKNGKQYISVYADEQYSFHRFFVGVTHMSLEPEVVGLGYKSVVYGDEMVFAELADSRAFIFRVQLEGYNSVYRYFDSCELNSGDPIALRIRSYDVENYSEHNLYAQVSLVLNDGTVIETEQVALTFRWLTEQVNANYTDYTEEQLAQFKAMLKQFSVVENWNLQNLFSAVRVLDLSDQANRTSLDSEQQIWEQNGITLINNRGTSAVAGIVPIRLYAQSEVIIRCANMSRLEFDCTGVDSKYTTYTDNLYKSLQSISGITVTKEGTIISVQLETVADEFKLTSGQGRVVALNVYTVE